MLLTGLHAWQGTPVLVGAYVLKIESLPPVVHGTYLFQVSLCRARMWHSTGSILVVKFYM